ncbi:hypothetical protein R6Q59_034709 [Mikania micrantha]
MGSSKDDSATDGDKSTPNRRRPDSDSNLYSDGEKVLAYHGPRIYEAKACSFLIFYFIPLYHFSHKLPLSSSFHAI